MAIFAPWLTALPKPTFLSLDTILTFGYLLEIISTVLSYELLSTTIIS